MKPSELLRAARAKITEPTHWTQRTYARNSVGEPVHLVSEDAVCWCMLGALHSVDINERSFTGTYSKAIYFLELATDSQSIAVFNDQPTRKHAEILAMYDRAVELAERAERIEVSK